MQELKQEATELGLDFKGNISKADLTSLIADAKNSVAKSSPDVKPSKPKRIKVVISARDSEEKEGYVGFNGYQAQYKFDEEIEMPEDVVEFLRSKGGYVTDGKGDKKWMSRFIIEVR